MTLARQERHRGGRYPTVNATPASSDTAIGEAARQFWRFVDDVLEATCSRVDASGKWCNESGHAPGCPMSASSPVVPALAFDLERADQGVDFGFRVGAGAAGHTAEVLGDVATDSIR